MRFKRAIQLIVKISTTLPIAFLRAHLHHDVFKAIIKNPDEQNDKLWTSSIEYRSEGNFDSAFDKFMSEKIVGAIFRESVEYVSHDDFINKFTRRSPSLFKKKK